MATQNRQHGLYDFGSLDISYGVKVGFVRYQSTSQSFCQSDAIQSKIKRNTQPPKLSNDVHDFECRISECDGDEINDVELPLCKKSIAELMEQNSWVEVWRIIEKRAIDFPNEAVKEVEICLNSHIFQGRILHAVCHITDLNLSTLNALLTAFPKAATEQDIRYSRLPIHTACMKGLPLGIIYALIHAHRAGLQVNDHDGNLPLHHACSHSSNDVVLALIEACPEATQVNNNKQELPLHIACSRWDASKLVVDCLLSKFPEACQYGNIQGFLPIHSACMWRVPVQVIELLVETNPRSILSRDNDGDAPFDLLKNNEVSTDDPTMIFVKNAMSSVGGIVERATSQIKLVSFEIESFRKEQLSKRILRESSLKRIKHVNHS